MESFEKFLININHPCKDLYYYLPFDIQEMIYHELTSKMDSEKTKRNKIKLCSELKKKVRKTQLESYGGSRGGAWEYLYIKKNEWIELSTKPDDDLYDNLSLSALEFCRNELLE